MKIPEMCLAVVIVVATAFPVHSADVPATFTTPMHEYWTWGIGRTGIYCVQEPCPWRGVFPIGEDGKWQRPIASANQSQLPRMSGTHGDLERIAAAYAESRCLAVEARFDGLVLDVRRIIGEC